MNSIKKTARLSGILYLLLGVFGAFGIMYIPSLIVPGEAAATTNNIIASESLFRFSIVSGLIAQTIFIFLVLVLYKLLKPVNKNHALLMVVFALVSVPITMLNQVNQISALLLLSGSDYLSVFSVDQIQAQVMFFLGVAENGVAIAQIFWGLWLLPFGYLIFKSGFLPKVLGILLMIGCFGYLIDVFTFFLLPNFDASISHVTSIGELLFPLWVLIKGINAEHLGKSAFEAA
jgi:hypothetical protein